MVTGTLSFFLICLMEMTMSYQFYSAHRPPQLGPLGPCTVLVVCAMSPC